MPTNIVRTEADERLWKRAKARAAAEGQAENYAYVTAIYQRMRAGSVDKAFRDAYGSPSADWFRSIHRQTGAPLDELHKARRRGRALAPEGMPVRASEYIEVCRVALEKAQKAPRGYSPIPRSKRGGYRKKVGGKWRYWYPGRLQVNVDGSLPDEIRDDAASSGVVERVGVVRSDMSLHEVETAIRDADLEHVVTFRGGEQVYRARGTENRVSVDPFEVQEWRESGDCLLTHNHPSGTCLSDSDILLAVGADLEEIRAVTPSGGVFSMVRPDQGWGRAGGLSGAEVKAFLRAAYVRIARRTASRMDEIVRAAGGDPEDGLEAKGYDDKEWHRLWSQHSEEEYQREFRSQGLGWSIEHHGPRHHPLDDDGARPGGDPGVSAALEKSRVRRLLAGAGIQPTPSFAGLLAKASSKPPAGYTPTPGSKIGSYRRRVRGGYEYWTPPKAKAPKGATLRFLRDLRDGTGATPVKDAKADHVQQAVEMGYVTTHKQDSGLRRLASWKPGEWTHFARLTPAGKRAVDKMRREADRKAEASQQSLFGAPQEQPAAPVASDAVHYASGSNRAPDIRAFAAIRQPIGLEVSKLSDASFEALEDSVADRGIPVFLDSGAFNELGGEEITPKEWDRRLALYDRAARLLGDQLVVVAPDKVGDQDQTLARMREYAERVYDLTAFGTRVLVPLQGGDRTLAEFAPQAYDALGAEIDKDSDLYVPAFPSKKAPVPIDQIEEFLRLYQPARVHFLGLGPSTKRKTPDGVPMLQAIQEAVREHSPGTLVTLDSNLIRSAVGKDRGPKGSRFTVAQERARELVAELSGPETVSGAMLPAYTEAVMNAMGAPHLAFSRDQLRRIGKKAGLKGQELSRWSRAPHRYTASSDAQDAALTRELEAEAVRLYLDQPTTDARKILAVQQAFGPEPGLFRSLLQTVTLRKAAKPPPGYTPVPGSKVGGYRKRIGGKWDYWYPQQLGLFDQPKEAPKPKKKTREEINRARYRDLIFEIVKHQAQEEATSIWNQVDKKLREAVENSRFNFTMDEKEDRLAPVLEALDKIIYGVPYDINPSVDNPLLSILEKAGRGQVAASLVNNSSDAPQSSEEHEVSRWIDGEFYSFLSSHPEMKALDAAPFVEQQKRARELLNEYLQRFVREKVVDLREMVTMAAEDMGLSPEELERRSALFYANRFYDDSSSPDSVVRRPDRMRQLIDAKAKFGRAALQIDEAKLLLREPELVDRLIELNPGLDLEDELTYMGRKRTVRQIIESTFDSGEADPGKMLLDLDNKFSRSSNLGHWGSASSGNWTAMETALFGDEGRFRPLDLDMALLTVATARVGTPRRSPAERVLDLNSQLVGVRRYLFAQEKMRQFPASEYPVLYRGMGLPKDLLRSVAAGTRLKLTGCTAFAFEHSTAAHYSRSNWTLDQSKEGAVPVLVELRRTAEFDETVAGWHPNKGMPYAKPAFEIVSGANALEIDEVIRNTQIKGLARLAGVDFSPEDTKVYFDERESIEHVGEAAIVAKIEAKLGEPYTALLRGRAAEKAGFSPEQLKGVTSIRIGDYAPGHPGEFYRDSDKDDVWKYRGSDELHLGERKNMNQKDELPMGELFMVLRELATREYTLIRARGVLDDV